MLKNFTRPPPSGQLQETCLIAADHTHKICSAASCTPAFKNLQQYDPFIGVGHVCFVSLRFVSFRFVIALLVSLGTQETAREGLRANHQRNSREAWTLKIPELEGGGGSSLLCRSR